MGYVAYTGNTTAAVTTDNKSTIAIACPTSTHVQWQTADVTVLTPSLPGAASVATVYDVTGPASNDTTYVAKVIVNPTYQGDVIVSLAGLSFNTTSGGQIALTAAPLTYHKQAACVQVVTTGTEYT